MKKAFLPLLLTAGLLAGLLTGCAASGTETPTNTAAAAEAGATPAATLALVSTDTGDDTWEEEGACTITLNGSEATVSGSGASIADGVCTISSAGVYILTGTWDDGMILINAGKKDEVQLVLQNAHITSSRGAVIAAVQAESLTITLAEGTDNSLTDAAVYSYNYGDTEVTGCLYSQDDLELTGTGSLTLTANAADGIVCKDTLTIKGGVYTVTAADDGLLGRDGIEISTAVMTLVTGGDGMKTTVEDDPEKGFISIADGTYVITAGADGIQAVTTLTLGEGSYTITTGGGAANGSSGSSQWGGRGGFSMEETDSTASCKGLKAGTEISILGGSYALDTADDALHCNGSIYISGGTGSLSSGDDGIHADSLVSLSGGSWSVTKSYEGIEGSNITISGGDWSVVASDDGVNVSGGNDSSSTGGGWGSDMFADNGGVLTITGGTLAVNAGGDGLDSNGSIAISGGVITVDGPTDSGNGALDCNGTFTVSGGVLIAGGSAGMAETPDTSSTQCVLAVSVSGSAGTEFLLKDASGNTLLSYTCAKQVSHIVFSSPDLTQGQTYTLYANGSQVGSYTLSSVITGASNGTGGGSTGGGFGGGGRGGR